MRKLIVGVVSLIFSATLAVASPQHGKDDHQDREDHHDRDDHRAHGNPHDRDDHHDNGKHLGWEKHEVSVHDSHDFDHDRGHTVVVYPHGRYANVRKVYVSRSFDVHAHRVILEDRSSWVVTTADLGRCHDWAWGRDKVYVYEDDIHPGMYLLFNARLGNSVHVTFFGTP